SHMSRYILWLSSRSVHHDLAPFSRNRASLCLHPKTDPQSILLKTGLCPELRLWGARSSRISPASRPWRAVATPQGGGAMAADQGQVEIGPDPGRRLAHGGNRVHAVHRRRNDSGIAVEVGMLVRWLQPAQGQVDRRIALHFHLEALAADRPGRIQMFLAHQP